MGIVLAERMSISPSKWPRVIGLIDIPLHASVLLDYCGGLCLLPTAEYMHICLCKRDRSDRRADVEEL